MAICFYRYRNIPRYCSKFAVFFKYRTVFNVSVKEFFDDVSFTSENMIDLYEVVQKV